MPAFITGTVFHDMDHDGRFTPGEPGIPGVNVVLYSADSTQPGSPACTFVQTGTDGVYSFTVTEPGTYTVYETAIFPGSCPPSLVSQPPGYYHSNTPRKGTVILTQEEISGDNTVNGPDFGHDMWGIPYNCGPEMILFEGEQPTGRFAVNLVTGDAADMGPVQSPAAVNAVGFNTEDNFIYGYDQVQNTIVRVDQNGDVMYLEPRPEGMPAAAYSAGAIDMSGFYYVYIPGGSRFYTVDLRPDSATFLRLVDPSDGYREQTEDYGTALSSPLAIGDWAFNPADGRLYGVERNGVVYRINELTGDVAPLDTTGPNPGAPFGAVAVDGNGNLYAVSSSDGTIYRYRLSGYSAAGMRFSATQPGSFIDAAMCPYAIIETDFGDAPDAGGGGGAGNYNTLLASNGPRHGLGSPLYLGTRVTSEDDAHQSAMADGDDLTQGIQDDALTLPLPVLPVDALNYSLTAAVTNDTGDTANLYGWIDFNKNGLFEASEAAAVIQIPPYSGTGQYTLDFGRPPGSALTPDHTFLRLRLTTDDLQDTGTEIQDTRSVGPASDGEVEDYILKIGTTTDLSVTKTADLQVLSTGDTITYTITVSNYGPEDAYDVLLTDIVPPEITGARYSLDGGPSDYWPGTLVLGTMAPGQVNTVVIQGVFDGSVLGPVINTATVTSYSEDPDPGNNSATTVTPVDRAADLEITKTADESFAVIGETFTFNITVTNHGPDPAENTIINDIAAADFSTPEYSADGGTSWMPWHGQLDAGIIEAGTAFTFLLRGTVEAGTQDELQNTASVTSDTSDPDPSDNTVTITVPKSALADLGVIKTGEPDPVSVGQQLIYTITVTNSGPSQAEEVIISDALPAELLNQEYSFDSVIWYPWTGEYAAGSLAAGEIYTLYLRGDVDPDAQTGEMMNTVMVSSATDDPDPNNNTYTEIITVEAAADLSVTKTASPSAVLSGEILTYTVVVSNDGPSDAANVVLSDTLPAEIENPVFSVDGSAEEPWTGSYSLSILPAGSSFTLTIRGTVNVTQTESLVNTSFVASDTPDPIPDNNADTVITQAEALADLTLVKEGPASVEAGGMISYTVTVSNAGPGAAADVEVTDAVPSEINAPEYSVNGGVYIPWSGSFRAGTLEVSESVTIMIRGNVSSLAAGTVVNSASVTSSTPDPDPSDNSGTVTTSVEASADISVVKTASPSPAVPGQHLTYTLVVSNAGPSAAAGVILEDELPPVLTGAEVSADEQNWAPWSSPYSVGTLDAGGAAVVYVRGTVAASAVNTIANTASVSSDTPDPDMGNNTSSTATPVDPSADISVTKTASPSPVLPGGELTYTVTISNAGPADAQNTELADTLPSLLANPQFSTDNGISWNDWPGFLNVGTIAADASAEVLIRGTVNSAAAGILSNTAAVSSATPDPDPVNNTDTVLTPIETSADVSVTKTAAPVPAGPGQQLTYTIVVNNAGPDTAQAVSVTDSTAPELSGPEFSADGGNTWNPWVNPYAAGDIASGDSIQILLRGTLSSAASGIVNNSVSAAAQTPDPDPDNNIFTLNTPVSTSADLSVTKTAEEGTAVPGNLYNYLVNIINGGPDTAADVTMTDSDMMGLQNPEYSLDGITYSPWTGSIYLGSMADGQSITVHLRGTIDPEAEGDLMNRVFVASSTPDPDMTNNNDAAETALVPSADLSITKSGIPDPAVPGKVLTYTLTVKNAGPSAARDITVIDAVPGILENAEYSTDGIPGWQPWTGTYQSDVMAPGSELSLTIRGVLASLASGTVINTAVVTSATPDPDPSDNKAVDERQIQPEADLSLVKSVSPSPAVPGQCVTYTLTASNAGPSDAVNVQFTDMLPQVLQNQEYSIDGGISWHPWSGTYEMTSLAGGTAAEILVRGLLPLNEAGAGILRNTASVESETDDPDPGNNTAVIETPVSGLADLKITKSAVPETAAPGGLLTYYVDVRNLGPEEAEQVTIEDKAVLSELTDTEYSTDGGSTWSRWSGSYVIGSMAAGESYSDLAIRGRVSQNAAETANAAVVKSSTPDPDPDNNTSTVVVKVYDTADLAVTKTASPVPAVPGQRVVYTVTVTNNGPGTARGIAVIDAVPSQLTDAEYSADNGLTWEKWDSVYRISELSAGSSTAIKIRGDLKLSSSGTITNTAAVTSSTPDPHPENNTATDITKIQESADISVSKLAHPVPARPGQYLTYIVLVSNAGPSDARDVNLSDIVPDAEYSLDEGITWQAWTGTHQIGTVAAGEVRRILIRTRVQSGASGYIINTVSVSSATPDPDPDNNTATVGTPVAQTADLSLQKTADKSSARPGDVVTYQIVIRHLGSVRARNVRLRDDGPDGLSGVEFSTDGGDSWSPWISPYPLGDMEDQETRVILIRGTVTLASGVITNTAYVTSDTPDPDYTNNIDHSSVAVGTGPSADLAVSKTVSSGTVCPCRPVVFRIIVSNRGPDTAQDVKMTDFLPSVIQNAHYSLNEGSSWFPWHGQISLGSLANGASAVILISGYVDRCASGTILNQASAASSTYDPDPLNNQAVAEFCVCRK